MPALPLLYAPDGSDTKLAAVVVCHCGSLIDGAAATQPIKRFGQPVLDTMGPMGYCQVNAMLDTAYPRGALNYWKANFLADLSETMVECYQKCPSPMTQILLDALSRSGDSRTARRHVSTGVATVARASSTRAPPAVSGMSPERGEPPDGDQQPASNPAIDTGRSGRSASFS